MKLTIIFERDGLKVERILSGETVKTLTSEKLGNLVNGMFYDADAHLKQRQANEAKQA